MTTGRGAWTTIGGTTPYYSLMTPKLGNIAANVDPSADTERAVVYGIMAIQTRINQIGFTPALIVDGVYGTKTDSGVRWAQGKYGLVADGQVGPVTAQRWWRTPIVMAEVTYSIPGHHLYGIGMHESNLDPGAVGYYTPDDKGFFQFNLPSHPDMTLAQAFSTEWAIHEAASRLSIARRKFAGKGPALRDSCSIAQHNSPLWAQQWYDAGSPPNTAIAKYVRSVLDAAGSF